MNLDYPVADSLEVTDASQLCAELQRRERVRLIGGGSSQAFLPAPDTEVDVISTAAMNRILRLEADDLTCSVEPGVRRADLDAALAEHQLWLPCGGDGTIAGIFAGDRLGALAPTQPEPRSLLLGMSAVLTDGTCFKSGARVVKNVAGFDLQKLFVGSRGRLFAVTALHLKLRPRPKASAAFEQTGLGLDDAMQQLIGMRRSRTSPQRLSLIRNPQSFTITGSIASDPRYLEQWLDEFGLVATSGPTATDGIAGDPGAAETVQGMVPLKSLPTLIESLPATAPFALHGTRFTTELTAAASDSLLASLAGLGGCGEVIGGPPTRRGTTSPSDPVADRLEAELGRALDPRGVLR